nr:hypothetical protein [Tanacetum cinerariifolium]
PSAPIIEDWVSDLEDESEAEPTQNAPSFVQPAEHVKTPRPFVKPVEHSIPANNPWKDNPKSRGHSNRRNKKTCFVCKSLTHLIKDCDYYGKQMVQKPARNYAHRGNNQHYARMIHPNPQRHVVPTAVLTRHINRSPSPKDSTLAPKVTAAKAPMVNAVKGRQGKWGNPQHALKDKGVIDSGCSRHMTGNMSYLSNFEELNGGYVAFGGNLKGGKIFRKGKIKTGKLDFDDVYFVKKLKFNLFSVLQMCDKKNNVIFIDTKCIVLSPEFKLPDENQVLLRVPRENNMYNVDLKNIVLSGNLTYLFAKATLDESNLWHRRLGHINFKTINKLVKGNLVRGLPTKVFENDNKCIACKKGKQHRASCKTKLAEALNTACYAQNRVLVTKPHNKTPYELLHGRTPSIGFMRPFGCHMTILNTLDSLGKFDGKVDEGFLVGYSVSSKAFRVFNSKTRLVQETLHINFLENKPNVTCSGPTWLFDIDTLTRTMNYQLVTAGNQSNLSVGVQEQFNAEKAGEENVQQHVLFPVCSSSSTNPQNTDEDAAFEEKEPKFEGRKHESEVYVSPRKFEDFSDNNINEVNAAGNLVHAVGKSSFVGTSQLPDDPDMPELEDITYSDDEEDVGAEANFTNLETTITISPIPTTRVHKDHLVTQIIGDLSSATQTRSMKRVAKDQGGLSQINNDDFHTYGKSASTPIDTEKPLLKDPGGEDVDVYTYRSMIGLLIYLTSSRPDIMFAVCACARFQVTSKVSHLHAFKRIFRYLKGKPHLGLWYPKKSPFNLVAYSDSDYAGASLDRKSTTEGCQFLRCRLISWRCKKQTVVATSSTKAKYVAAASGNLLSKTTREALKIIKNKSKVRYSRSKSNVSRVNTNSRDSASKTVDRIDKLADQISNLVEIVNKQVMTPASAKAVEKTCVIYGGAHAYYDCIVTDSNQPSVFVGFQNQPFSVRNNQIQPGIPNELSSYMKSNESLIRNMQNQINVLRGDFNKKKENLRRNLNNDMRSTSGSLFQNQASTLGTLLSNTVPNLKGEMKDVTTRSGLAYEGPQIPTNSPLEKGEMKDVTTRSGLAYEGPQIPTNSPLEKVVERDTKESTDKEHSNCQGSTAHIQPLVVPISIPEPDSLLTNKDKLFELAKVPLNENCSAMLLKKLPEKIGDPGKFLIPCDFLGIDVCHALADLGESINLMPLSIWKKLSLPELTPTRMTLELADRSITRPKGATEDVFIKVGKFHFLTDFVIVDFEADPRVPLILGRSFLRTGRALIDVYGEEIALRVNNESVTFNLNQTMRYSSTYDDNSVNRVDVIDIACEEFVQDVFDFQYNSKNSNPTLVSNLSNSESESYKETIVKSFSPTLTPFGENPEGDILYLEKLLNDDPFQLPPMDLKQAEETKAKSSIEEPPELELKESPSHLKYAFLEDTNKLPVIISKDLKDVEKEALIKVLKSHKGGIAWKISDIKGIDPRFCTHKILMEEDYKPAVQSQRQIPKTKRKQLSHALWNFRYRRMPFGLCNAPDKMLKRCEDTNLVLNWEKCHFMCKEGIVLGHKILKSGIEVDRAKVDVIAKLPHPTTVKGVRSFLGHAGFYRRFIQDFSKIARPMTQLLKKETPFVFSKECIDAFNTLKQKLTEAPIL